MGKPKKETPKPRQSYNAVIQMQVAQQRGEAAGRLLAAEAEYLTAHGWRPAVVTTPTLDDGLPRVMWISPRNFTFRQSHAVEIVRSEDVNLLGH